MTTTQITDLEKLAEICLENARILKAALVKSNTSQPTFSVDSPTDWPELGFEAAQARLSIRNASKQLYELATGPAEMVTQTVYPNLMDFYAYRYINEYGILQAVPLHISISYTELAKNTGTDVGQLKQMLRQLMMVHVFAEPQLNHVTHSAASKALLEPMVSAFNQWIVFDEFDFVAKGVEAIQKWGHGAQEPTQAPLQLGYKTDLPMFQAFEERPSSRKRFAAIMTSVSQSSVYSADHLLDYDWSALGDGTVVDVGGNRGHCCVLIAKANLRLKFIVQDLPQIIEQAKDPGTTLVPDDLRDRIEFMAYDFYQPEPVQGAAVYFLRTIIHMLPDEKAIKVIQNLVDAMKPSSKLLIMDQIMPLVGSVPPVVERMMRTQDLNMMCLSNARERDWSQWLELLAAADQRLKITKNISLPGRAHSILEVSLIDSENVPT